MPPAFSKHKIGFSRIAASRHTRGKGSSRETKAKMSDFAQRLLGHLGEIRDGTPMAPTPRKCRN